MIHNIYKTSNQITISEYVFRIVSYKISHSENSAKHFTVSGDTFVFRKGVNPFTLSLSVNCTVNDSAVITVLENSLLSDTLHSFTVDGLLFSEMKLCEYSAEKNINGTLKNINMTFTSVAEIQEAVDNG